MTYQGAGAKIDPVTGEGGCRHRPGQYPCSDLAHLASPGHRQLFSPAYQICSHGSLCPNTKLWELFPPLSFIHNDKVLLSHPTATYSQQIYILGSGTELWSTLSVQQFSSDSEKEATCSGKGAHKALNAWRDLQRPPQETNFGGWNHTKVDSTWHLTSLFM